MKKILALITGIILLASGCVISVDNEIPPESGTPAPETSPIAAKPTPVPQDGGTLRLSMRAPKTLNPLLNEDITVDHILKLVFEPLVRLDDTLKPTAHIASLEFSLDGASVTLTIRDDAIWSDGTPVTAEDVIFSIEVLQKAPETAIYKSYITNIAQWTVQDSKTLTIHFAETYGGSSYLFNFPVIPKHYYRNETDPGSAKNMAPLGNGLFIFENYTHMKSMRLTRSAYSFQKRAYIENVEVLVIPDAETDLNAFDQGLTDVYVSEITEWSRHHSVKEIRYADFAGTYYDFIGFNFQNTVLQQLSIRQALAHAVDWDALLSGIYLEHAARTLTPVNPESWMYEPNVTVYPYDIETAKNLVAQVNQAAVTDDTSTSDTGTDAAADSGLISEEIPPLRILVNAENSERNKIAAALADGMQAIGLPAEVESLPFDVYHQKITQKDFDIFVGGYNLSVIPDLTFAFHSYNIRTGTNLLSYNDAYLDQLLTAALSAGSEISYRRTLSDIQKLIAEQLPVISLTFRKSALLTDTRIYGTLNPSPDNIFAQVNEWYIAAE